jgi:MFS family permease
LSIRLIIFLTVLTHLSFAGFRVIISLTAIHYEATPFTVGVVMSLLTVVPMLFAVRWGRYVDRIGVRGPMLAGAALILAAMVLGWAVPRLETLFVASALAGSGFFLYHIAVGQAAALIGNPEERVRNFTLLALAFSASGFLGPMLAGFAIDGIGHHWAMLALASAALTTVVVLSARRIETPRHAASAAHGEKQRLRDLLLAPGFRRIFAVSGTLSVTWDLFAFVTPIYGSQIGLSASTIGLILGCFGGAVFAVRLVLPVLAHRVNAWRLLIAAMLLSGALLFAFPLVKDVPQLMALSFLLGLGLGGTQPYIMSLLYEIAPPGRGAEVLSVRTWLINFSQTGVPLASGAIGAAAGMLPVFWGMGAALLFAGWFATRRK